MAESAIKSVMGKIVDYSTDAIKKQVNYLCFHSSNVQTLVGELEELNNRYETVQQQVESARANSEDITPEVDTWLRNVELLKIRSDEILRDYEETQRSSVRKWLARKARKAATDCVELRNTEFDTISNPVIPVEIPRVPTPSYYSFKSHKVIEDTIMHALRVPNIYSIGICGVGGVGKTVMAMKIGEKVRNEKSLFEHVVMVVVSQKPDLLQLRWQIAERLGLTLSEESHEFQKRQLYKKLMAKKSILIILDDLWERLDLVELGIPSQSEYCKLILTSRKKNALISTGVQNLFQLEILTEEESWRFFRDNAGINDDDSHELVEVARKVAKECNKFPLALKIVASTLKGKHIYSWENALEELKKVAQENISSVIKDVHQPLKYNFEMLKSKEQKYLFLLCCLFPEGYPISIEELLRCGMGLRIFSGLNNLTVVRNKVKVVLDTLLSRSLLIKENEYREDFDKVRMHDLIRRVGIWIATEEGMVVGSNGEKHLFMISHGLNECPLMTEEDSSNINNCTFISLLFSHPSITFPKSIVYPKLEFLRLDAVHNVKLPENFFNGMGELKVLEALRIRLLPPSIGELNSLRTLFLHESEIFQAISMLGKLINLEILSLESCAFEMLPVEIGGLKKLKQMHILKCESLRKIAFGVISELVRLEELVILGSFDKWEAKDGGEKGVACLSELNHLEYLTTLKIEIEDPSVVPVEKPLWVKKLKKYGISISNRGLNQRHHKAILLGKEVVNPLGDWVYDMASNAEYLILEGSNCMNVLKGLSQNSRNLSYLKELGLSMFTNMLYLADGLQNGAIFPMLESLDIYDSDSLQQISGVSPSIGSFEALQCINFNWLPGLIYLWKVSLNEHLCLKNLQSIKISECHNLSYLFSLRVAQSLVQLSDLNVQYCATMKEIFKKHDGELVEKIELPKLRSLYFEDLKSFHHICNGIDRIDLPQLDEFTLYNLPSMKMTKVDNKEVHQLYLFPKVAGMNFNFHGLSLLRVEGIGNFKCLISLSIISQIPNLSKLEVRNCSMLVQVIGKDDEIVGKTISFPNLREIILAMLPNILTFCNNIIQLPSLEQLVISNCPKMLKFVEELPNHISNSTHFINEQVHCPKLRFLYLHKLNISAVFSPFTFKSLTYLISLDINGCKELEHMIIKEGETPSEEFMQKVPLCNLYLRKLPKLYGSIFQMKHPLEFPSLDDIGIKDCPRLEKFSLGSVHLPQLEIISTLKNHSENNYFTISIKDISFSSNLPQDVMLYFLPIGSSQSFANVVFFEKSTKIVGKFKTQKIQTGIEYEIMLMITLDEAWKDPVEIEVKIPGESKLQQRTEIMKNQVKRIWTEISIGKFIMREPEQINEEFEFSLRNVESEIPDLFIKGVRIVEV